MTRRRHVLVAALAGLAVSACAVKPQSPTAEKAATPVVVVREDVSARYIEFIGPKILYAEPFLGVPDTNYFALRSWLDKRTGVVTHQLYVSESYVGARRTWQSARDGKGDPLPIAAIGNHKIACRPSCSYTDDFAATLPDALLRGSPGGLAVTFVAQGGSLKTIAVPAEVVQVELATIDTWRRRLEPVKTASTASPAPDRRPSSR
ncbi:MAG TPA: hypothetical protein VGR91_05830 [Stellaceae bacterium]|nr:hypothetical protein [Stellaceae bacterium]